MVRQRCEARLRRRYPASTSLLIRRRSDVDLPGDGRTGMRVEEALCRDRKTLGVSRVRRHPGLAQRQSSVRGVANADEAEPLGLRHRRQTRRPEFAWGKGGWVIGTIERHGLADLGGP